MSCNFPVVVAVDSKPVYDHVHSQVVTIRDKRIAIEMLLVKQDVQKKNIVLKWIPTYQMIADPFDEAKCTKRAFAKSDSRRKVCDVAKMIPSKGGQG